MLMLAEDKTNEIGLYIADLGKQAKSAARIAARTSTHDKNRALSAIGDALDRSRDAIARANQKDLDAGMSRNLEPALLDRLALTPARIDSMIDGVRQIAMLADPVGQISNMNAQPSGIRVGKMRIPLGVIGIIYESRPNVTIDAAALCLKSGNATILRGGSEAYHSNQALADCIRAGLVEAGLPETLIQVIATTDRSAVGKLLRSSDYVDVIIPRGGRSLIERVSKESTIPVIKHLDGNCHVYIDSDADKDKAIAVAYNAKARRYGICGAMETLLVSQEKAAQVLPELIQMYRKKEIEVRACEETSALVDGLKSADEQDWYTEFHGPVLAVRIVEGLDQAIEHIEKYGSRHTDSIVTENLSHANRFLTEVDSSSVMVNTSTQFADGFEYGLGAEIGISTNKLHVRGPVGLEGLTTQKFIVIGDGHIRP